MDSKKLIQHINPSKYLATLISYAIASDILHIFEKEFPNDLRPRKALDLVKRYLDGEDVSGEEFSLVAADAYAVYANAAANAAAYAAANAANAAHAAANAAAAADDAYAAAYAAHAASWATKATSEEHVIKLIYSMMPQIIDYTIKNQVKLFTGSGDFTEVFDKLDDEVREEVIWNVELMIR